MFKRLREGIFKRTEDTIVDASAPPQSSDAADVVEEADAQLGDTAPTIHATEPAFPPLPEAHTEVVGAGDPLVMQVTSASSAPVQDAVVTTDDDLQVDTAADEDEVDTTSGQSASKRGFFRNPFGLSLGRTRQLFGRVSTAFETDEEITESIWDELEETLITSDVGVQTTEHLMSTLRERVTAEHLTHGKQLRSALKEELAVLLGDPEPLVVSDTSRISVYLVVGVNGVGKTTSIAKLANLLKRQKHRVMLVAGDTFRAAAIEQLRTWGDRIGLPVISHQHGADPGAVVYDAMQASQARGSDVLIVDTAGRLHTKFNLMEELKKIMRVLQKYDPEAPHEVLLVMDATTGQNGFLQAKQFVQDAGVSGVILTKLDGTARGGIAFAVASELGLPIKFIGTGEQVNDIAPFDPDQFVDALFEED